MQGHGDTWGQESGGEVQQTLYQKAEQRDLSRVGSEWRPWLRERPPSYIGLRGSWGQPTGVARGIVSGVASDLLRLWLWRGLSRGWPRRCGQSGGAGRKQESWCRPRGRPGQRKWPGQGAFEVGPRRAGQMETRWRPGQPAGLAFHPETSWALPRPPRVDVGTWPPRPSAQPSSGLHGAGDAPGTWEPGGGCVWPWGTPPPTHAGFRDGQWDPPRGSRRPGRRVGKGHWDPGNPQKTQTKYRIGHAA